MKKGVLTCFHSKFGRHLAMDEGGLPTFLDSPDRSYIPGKPHPNCFEYFGLGDQFMMHILWDKPHIDQKYARPKEMKALVLKFAEFLERYKDDWTGRIPPFHLYLDSRFSSLELMKDLKQMGLYATMSLSVSASPQGLYNWLRTDLQKREWRVIYLDRLNSTLTVVRAKKKAYVNLLSNYWTGGSVTVQHSRVKYPKAKFDVNCPEVQKQYNLHKNKVDVYNSQVLNYRSKVRLNSEDEAYFHYFIQALTTNCFIWWKTKEKKEVDQLTFRIRLVKQLFELLIGKPEEIPKAKVHWPGPLSQQVQCQGERCRNHARKHCKMCHLSLCGNCMESRHKNLWS